MTLSKEEEAEFFIKQWTENLITWNDFHTKLEELGFLVEIIKKNGSLHVALYKRLN